MERFFHQATAEKGLGFFSFDPAARLVKWEAETARSLGDAAGPEGNNLSRRMTSGLRSYVLRGLTGGSKERLRCLVPLNGEVVEVVILAADGAGGPRRGFYSPYSLQEPLDAMKKYFLSSISNRLRSLLNSVIIASDVVAAAGRDTLSQERKFLSLMAKDAREVNTLLNQLSEIVTYTASSALGMGAFIEVPALLAAVHGNLQHLAEDSSVALTLAVPEAIPPVRGSHLRTMLIFFLALYEALDRTAPLGEIILTAREADGWEIDVCFADASIPPDLALEGDRYGLAPVIPEGWSESVRLQLIDSLLGLWSSSLTFEANDQGQKVLRMPLPAA